MTGDDFWSRRKAAVRAEKVAEDRADAEAQEVERQNQLAEKPDEEILAKLELPDPDTLEKGDDFSAFLQKSVPQHLQRKALRRLWLSDPTLANLDSLVEYGEDYTDAARVIENLQTTYQVGKGMLKHILAVEEPDPEQDAEIYDDPEVAEAEQTPDATADTAAVEMSKVEDTEHLPETQNHEYTDMSVVQPTRRRMRFRFDDSENDASA